MYDFLIVGAGLFGATCARELTDAGKRVLVVDRRPHIAGNCHTVERDGQLMNEYGGHIFHTNSARLWEYVQRFGEWRQYSHHVKARVGKVVYSFPPNLMTYQQMGTSDPAAVRALFFEGYTEKMWGRPLSDVPPKVLERIPTRGDWSDEYFSDRYQAMPVKGYTDIVQTMLTGIDVRLGVDYLQERWLLDVQAARTIYSGALDELFDYEAGRLEYRGLRFEHWRYDGPQYQGAPTVNFPQKFVAHLREEEWRYFYPPAEPLPYSWVTTTYPGGAPAYPVNDARNNALAAEYKTRAEAAGYIVGGRLADYQYYDMHQAIAAALTTSKKVLGEP